MYNQNISDEYSPIEYINKNREEFDAYMDKEFAKYESVESHNKVLCVKGKRILFVNGIGTEISDKLDV